MAQGEPTISACILARNEQTRIDDALRSLQDWTDQLIVIDNESTDGTVAVAWRYTDCILSAPPATNFDAIRNMAIDAATGDWIFFLDADERVPPRLGPALRQLVQERGNEFEALCIPFKHHFCGQWMQHSGWWPGYKGPQLFKKGCFHYNERLHSGATVSGRTAFFPADDPDLAIIHYSYDDLDQYLEKLNRYTHGEADNLLADEASHSWQAMLAHFVQDWQLYYERGRADLDGMAGFVLAFMSGFYRFAARAKLWDLRRRNGELPGRAHVPGSLREMLQFMARVSQEGADRWLSLPSSADLNKDPARWAERYEKTDPTEIPGHYRRFTSIAYLARFLQRVLSLSPPGGRVLETGVGTGYGAIWLSQHGLRAEGIDYSEAIVEHANVTNRLLEGSAVFRYGDFFDLARYADGAYDVIFHQGVLEHFSDDEIRAILRSQVALARYVVFSVPSVHYPLGQEFGNERLLSLEQWGSLLAEFDVEAMDYYGDPRFGEREHIMGVLRGTAVPPEPAAAVQRQSPQPLPLLWKGPLFDSSGFADEGRNFVLGLIEAGEPIAVAPETWKQPDAGLAPELRVPIEERIVPADTPSDICVLHTLLAVQQPAPNAQFNVARALFETDRLPAGVADRLNRMDRIWVPSEFNRDTFVRNGVDPSRIAIVPEAIDAAAFAADEIEPWPVPGDERYRFLSVFDWTLHKGWDVLLEAFAAEFGGGGLLTAESAESAEGDADGEEDEEDERDEEGEPKARSVPSSSSSSSASSSSASSALSAVSYPVGLVLKVWSSQGYPLEKIREQADAHLRRKLGKGLDAFPNIHLWQETIPAAEMPRLYRAVDAFVLPTRGEGWGRPLMEAMASGLPTIATAWSGVTAFHNGEVGYPLKYRLMPVPPDGARELPLFAGHFWAEPSVSDLRRLLRRVVDDADPALAKGLAAQKLIAERFSRAAVAALLRGEIARCRELSAAKRALGLTEGQAARAIPGPATSTAAPALPAAPLSNGRTSPALRPNANPVPFDPPEPVDFRACLGRPLRIRWEGDQSLLSSLARVNRELCRGLLAAGDVELSIMERPGAWHTLTEEHDPHLAALLALRDAPLSGEPDITIRHHFPPDWSRPQTGKLVVMQPWEYGHLPREWVEGAIRHADEVWAYSRFVRDVYVRSGVPAEKVRIVPLGCDPQIFTPDGPRAALATQKAIRFLFVGGAIHRKGADLLLDAYLRAFRREDDVCLVVKDMGTRTFYQGDSRVDDFRRAQADPAAPEIVYLDDDLSDAELAALYRACTCVVLPYRGEGFGLPPLEGMACGLPAIVTAGGPTDDYLDDVKALRVPYRRRLSGHPHVGPFACVGDPWLLEPDLDALIAALRWVRDHPAEARERGESASTHVLAAWTWQHSLAKARERLLAFSSPAHPRPITAARPWAPPVAIEPCEDAPPSRSVDEEATRQHPTPNTQHPALPSPIPHRPSTINHPPELSLCMIVRDEEPRIESCLKSIAPFVDEIVVVDTGSSDRTREIAHACGARVFDFPWVDSFAEARNQSLDQGCGAWVFWMDADDVISPECGAGLRRLIRSHPNRDAAFHVQVHIPPAPGQFSPTVVDHIKLFPNRPDLRFEHRIHEQILPALRRAGIPIHFSDLYVTHEHYDRSDEGQARKRRRDFRLLDLELAEQPEHAFTLFNLGMTYLYATKEYEVAAHYLRRSLSRSDWRDSIVRKAYAMLATARICQGEWGAALAANEEGRTYYADDAELLFQAGQIYREMGRFAESQQTLERLICGSDEPHFRSVDVGLRTYRGRHELALLYHRMGDTPRCVAMLQEIVARQPDYLPARDDLAQALHRLGRHVEARALQAAAGGGLQ